MATRKELAALKPAYLQEHPSIRGKGRWSRGKKLREGAEAEASRAAAHKHVRLILLLWDKGWTLKQMAWKLKAPVQSVQWIVKKGLDAGHIQPDFTRLRWPNR